MDGTLCADLTPLSLFAPADPRTAAGRSGCVRRAAGSHGPRGRSDRGGGGCRRWHE